MKILFVCTGNTCRSPMAQTIFENILKKHNRDDITVSSAGTNAGDGMPMTPTAKEALKVCKQRVRRTPHSSTQFNQHMLGAYDHIVTMTNALAGQIGKYPNVYSLDSKTGCGDILDPYMSPLDVYVNACRMLQVALNQLYKQIVPKKGRQTK